MAALEKIEAQQKGKENTDVWMVGEQLKDMIRGEPLLEPIIDKDLDVSGMSLENAAGKIREYSDKNRKGQKCFCVPPNVAEGIIREFYGLPPALGSKPAPVTTPEPQPEPPKILGLSAFL